MESQIKIDQLNFFHRITILFAIDLTQIFDSEMKNIEIFFRQILRVKYEHLKITPQSGFCDSCHQYRIAVIVMGPIHGCGDRIMMLKFST